jgi:hypothetical protein
VAAAHAHAEAEHHEAAHLDAENEIAAVEAQIAGLGGAPPGRRGRAGTARGSQAGPVDCVFGLWI